MEPTQQSQTDSVQADVQLQRCTVCNTQKNVGEFMIITLASSSPLCELPNVSNRAASRVKARKSCNSCATKRKARDHKQSLAKRRKSDEKRIQSMHRYTWKEASAMIDNGFAISISLLTDTSSFKEDRVHLICDFYDDLPSSISGEDQKAVAQYVVDRIGDSVGFQFSFHEQCTISKRAQGLPNQFADGTTFRFRCSQRRRTVAVMRDLSLPYRRTRNRRATRQRFDCHGSINVRISPLGSEFDMAVDYTHALHPGDEQFGVPRSVRKWIQQNPRPTPAQQRDELFLAIQKGEVNGIPKHADYTVPAIHYWWRKGWLAVGLRASR
jgi:hypothetical protein